MLRSAEVEFTEIRVSFGKLKSVGAVPAVVSALKGPLAVLLEADVVVFVPEEQPLITKIDIVVIPANMRGICYSPIQRSN